ncbi:hypothetical protein ACEPAF_7338 [Sanghuangporus sanghuang]
MGKQSKSYPPRPEPSGSKQSQSNRDPHLPPGSTINSIPPNSRPLAERKVKQPPKPISPRPTGWGQK